MYVDEQEQQDIEHEKIVELLEVHEKLIIRYIMKKRLALRTRKILIKYYRTFINESNIERLYFLPCQKFMDVMIDTEV